MKKQDYRKTIKIIFFGGGITILLVVLGFLLWTIRSQHYELTTLRAAYVSNQSDLESGTRTLPEKWPIPPKNAPLPEEEDFAHEKDDCLPLPISLSCSRQDAPDAIVRFPRENRDEGEPRRSGQDGISATKEMPAYYEQLNAFIRPKWNAVAPFDLDLNISTWPVVDLSIAKDGRITKAAIVSKSGIMEVDDAVDALLADLKIVPAPPQISVIRIILDIR